MYPTYLKYPIYILCGISYSNLSYLSNLSSLSNLPYLSYLVLPLILFDPLNSFIQLVFAILCIPFSVFKPLDPTYPIYPAYQIYPIYLTYPFYPAESSFTLSIQLQLISSILSSTRVLCIQPILTLVFIQLVSSIICSPLIFLIPFFKFDLSNLLSYSCHFSYWSNLPYLAFKIEINNTYPVYLLVYSILFISLMILIQQIMCILFTPLLSS